MDKEEMKECAEWITYHWCEVGSGRTPQYKDNGEWRDEFMLSPSLKSDPNKWRTVEPQKTPVDMSVLIDSKMMCAFKDPSISKDLRVINRLRRITQDNRYENDNGHYYSVCHPLFEYIHAWQGGKCPLPEGVIVNVWFFGGKESRGPASTYDWGNCGPNRNPGRSIAQFEVIGLQDGYCWQVNDENNSD